MSFTAKPIRAVGDRTGAGLDRVVAMEEILLRMAHTLPFNNVSLEFPEATIYRWCNSMVDYLEFRTADDKLLDRIRKVLPGVGAALRSRLVFSSSEHGRLDVMVRCRCTPGNSTVRITENADCLWKPPVVYGGGTEALTVLAPTAPIFRTLYRDLAAVGSVEIVRKAPVSPDILRDSYTLSLGGLFGGLTAKQIEVLVSAVDAGYFQIPKQVSLLQIARKAKVGESTMQEHLSKAESKLLRALLPYLQLYRSATKP